MNFFCHLLRNSSSHHYSLFLPVLYSTCELAIGWLSSIDDCWIIGLWKTDILLAIHDPCGKSHCANAVASPPWAWSVMWSSNSMRRVQQHYFVLGGSIIAQQQLEQHEKVWPTFGS
jgi:hypothetical protein